MVDPGDVVQDFKRVQVALADEGKPLLLKVGSVVFDIREDDYLALF